MALRYNDATGEFEEIGGGNPSPPSSDSLRYNPETGEFEPIRRRGNSRRRTSGTPSTPGAAPRPPRTRPRPAPHLSPAPETHNLPSPEQFVESVRRRERRSRDNHQRLIRRLCRIGLVLAAIAFVFGGKELAMAALGIVFLLWLVHGMFAGAVWPWLVLGGIAAIYFLPTWLCIVLGLIVVIVLVP